MYTLLRALSGRELLFQQLPALGGSFLIAEMFYKFGSFGLEALAFLATWLVLDALIQTVSGVVSRAERGTARPVGTDAGALQGDVPMETRASDLLESNLDTTSETSERRESS
jgi:hypothetical protein